MAESVLFLGGRADGEYRVVEDFPITVITAENEPAHYYEVDSQNKDITFPVRKTKYVRRVIAFHGIEHVLVVAVPETYGVDPIGTEALFYNWVVSRLGK